MCTFVLKLLHISNTSQNQTLQKLFMTKFNFEEVVKIVHTFLLLLHLFCALKFMFVCFSCLIYTNVGGNAYSKYNPRPRRNVFFSVWQFYQFHRKLQAETFVKIAYFLKVLRKISKSILRYSRFTYIFRMVKTFCAIPKSQSIRLKIVQVWYYGSHQQIPAEQD